uniref:Uncharacterized protein n=1 Tax=Anguilla anguilla TaxID=7936 RepID=A0A0E9S2U6_ANGAN
MCSKTRLGSLPATPAPPPAPTAEDPTTLPLAVAAPMHEDAPPAAAPDILGKLSRLAAIRN